MLASIYDTLEFAGGDDRRVIIAGEDSQRLQGQGARYLPAVLLRLIIVLCEIGFCTTGKS